MSLKFGFNQREQRAFTGAGMTEQFVLRRLKETGLVATWREHSRGADAQKYLHASW